jgi:hypothetical protein
VTTAANNYTAAGDWDAPLQAYATANNITSWWTGNTQPWVQDQFKADLKSGHVANLNFIVPDGKMTCTPRARSRAPITGPRMSSRNRILRDLERSDQARGHRHHLRRRRIGDDRLLRLEPGA